jgi:ribosomal protein L21E
MSDMPTKNIFNLEKPEEYKCWMTGLTRGHQTLTVEIFRESDSRRLYFSLPQYLDTPIHWLGANFEIADREESIQIFRKMHPKDHLRIGEFIYDSEDNGYVVYVERTDMNKYIVAHSVHMKIDDDTD